MNLTKRIISSALVLSMAMLTILVEAYATSNTIKGQVFFEDGSPAAGVKINILSSNIDEVYDDEVVGFSNNYYTSVYTDSNGTYEFDRPSDYCLVEVDLDSLPTKTGISSWSSFLYPGETIEPLTIYQIADVALDSDNSIAVYNGDGDTIFTNIEVDNADSTINYADLLNLDSIEILQKVDANEFKVDLESNYDLSDYTFIEKVDALYNMELIDRETEVSMYLSAITNNGLSGLECATPIYDELASYCDDNPNSELSHQIAQNLLSTENRLKTRDDITYVDEKTETVGRFIIHFESNANESDYMSLSDLSKIITYVQNIDKAYFSEFGFKDPAYESGETKCHIYFASELDSATFPVKNASAPSGKGSYITIEYNKTSSSLADARETTLAHEIFHAIQQNYKTKTNNDLKWATESSATWASLRYYNKYRDKAAGRANSYLKDTTKSFSTYDKKGGYGIFLFFQYISQNYGDVAAIKRIYESFTNSGDIYSAVEHCSSSSTVPFKKLFAGFQAYNADTSHYNNYTNGTSRYINATVQGTDLMSISGKTLVPTSSMHFKYTKSTSSTKRIDFTLNVNGNYNDIAISLAKFTSSGTANLLRVYPNKSSSYTFSVLNFKSTNIKEVTVAVSNTNTSTTNNTFSLSAKIS